MLRLEPRPWISSPCCSHFHLFPRLMQLFVLTITLHTDRFNQFVHDTDGYYKENNAAILDIMRDWTFSKREFNAWIQFLMRDLIILMRNNAFTHLICCSVYDMYIVNFTMRDNALLGALCINNLMQRWRWHHLKD